MELIKYSLLLSVLASSLLQLLQGKSITYKPVNSHPPSADNTSDAAVVDSLLRAYSEQDNATLHRYLSNLLPMVNEEYHFETVGDLLAHLEGRNITTTENNSERGIHKVVVPHQGTELNDTGDSSKESSSSSSNSLGGSFKFLNKRSHRKHSSRVNYESLKSRELKSARKGNVNKVYSDNIIQPLSLQTQDNQTLNAQHMSERLNQTESKHIQKVVQYQTSSQLKTDETDNDGKNIDSNNDFRYPEQSVNNYSCRPNTLIPQPMNSKEPVMICTPKEIIDILRQSLSPAIQIMSNNNSTNNSNTRLEHELNKHETMPSPQVIEDAFKHSRFSAIQRKPKLNMRNSSLSESLPLASPPNETLNMRSNKKLKDKIKTNITVFENNEDLNVTFSFLSLKVNSTKNHLKQSRNHKSKNSSNMINFEYENINESRIDSIPLEERLIYNHSSTVKVQDLGNNDSSEIFVDPDNVSIRKSSVNDAQSLSRKEYLTKSSKKDDVNTFENTPMLNISLVDLIDKPRKDSSPLSSLSQRGNNIGPAHSVESIHMVSDTKHLPPERLSDGYAPKIQPHIYPRKLSSGLIPKGTQATLKDREESFKRNKNIQESFLQNGTLDLLEDSFDLNNHRNDRATVATHTSSLLAGEDDGMFKAEVGLAPLYSTASYISSEKKDTFRDTRAEDLRSPRLFTPHRDVITDNDEPLRMSFSQTPTDSSPDHLNSSTLRHNRYSHPLDPYIDDQLSPSWEDSVGDLMCHCEPGNTFDDWPSSNSTQYIRSMNHDEHLNPSHLDFSLSLHDLDTEDLNVTRRQSPSYSTWPNSCQQYYPSPLYGWQYYPSTWTTNNYVNFNVPTIFCPPCPRTCSDQPSKPRPYVCAPCSPLSCTSQHTPTCSKPHPNCLPHPKPCPIPCSAPPKFPPKVCPPWCYSPNVSNRPQYCTSCPLLPSCHICPNCGGNLGSTVSYFCPFCNHPTYTSKPYWNTCSNVYIPPSVYPQEHGHTCEINYDISCPACPDKCVYPNYPPRPTTCSPCPYKPPCYRPEPLPRCRPCPAGCVPVDYPKREYGCIPCPPLPNCSC